MALSVSGCQTSQFTAQTLPPELHAPVFESGQKLDLTKLAGPATSASRIEPGDVIDISLAGSLDRDDVTNIAVRVGEDGRAVLPNIGPLELGGLDLIWAEQQIAAACVRHELYRNPNVTVTMKQPRRNRVTVVGAVDKPGVHELPRAASYLMDAIVVAGGLTDDAGTKVEIRTSPEPSRLAGHGYPGVQTGYLSGERPVERVCLNLSEAVQRPNGGVYLSDGAVVRVEKLEPDPVQVMGLVQKPGEVRYPVKHPLRLLSAIALAGGPSSKLADKALVIRQSPRGAVAIDASIDAAKRDPAANLVLAPGDIVSIEKTPATIILDTLEVLRFGIGTNIPF